MKCHILFSEKNKKKNINSFSPAEFAFSVAKGCGKIYSMMPRFMELY